MVKIEGMEGKPCRGQDDALVAEDLYKSYRGSSQPSLRNISLRIRTGEFFALLGPNGAGKTTAVAILCGLLRPDSGKVRIFGLDQEPGKHAVRRLIGLAPQETGLYEGLTAQENLLFFGRMYDLHGTLLQERTDAMLELAGLTGQAGRPVATYSGGMKRRLNLAAALLHEPRLLFLDEPTVGVDAQSRHLIHQWLLESKKRGTTLLLTTHHMEEAARLCDRIGIIDQGTLITEGRPGALLLRHGCADLEELFLHLTGRQLRDD